MGCVSIDRCYVTCVFLIQLNVKTSFQQSAWWFCGHHHVNAKECVSSFFLAKYHFVDSSE